MNDKFPKFTPRKYLSNGHAQTIVNIVFPPKNTLRENYLFEDILIDTLDDTGDILWLEHNFPLESFQEHSLAFNGYYIILLHGMEGTTESHYMITLTKAALEKGFGVIRVNLRGCGRGEGYSHKAYHAGKTEDLEAIENFVYKNITKKFIFCGYSLSANMVLKHFGENKKIRASYFSAVSPPLDLKSSCEYIDSKEAKFYRDHFLAGVRKKIRSGVYKMSPVMMKSAFSAKTMFDFDDWVSAPFHGFKGALDYYKKSSSKNFIYNIKKRGIVIHADDDPIVPSYNYHSIQWKKIPNITSILTVGGGHVGFISSKSNQIPDGRWADKIILDYFLRQIEEDED
ncbi:MAG: alpha/beta hydrolase [Leptospiraceae bacterium]|nr:alpha/beta hydrolase [Leptospiraceae bacterium]MCK6380441.1 alpha/beta hydrolase [Leptospiraceae bacterium]NUM40695.1 alpha/beta hydrolase [Leptospiraceae bacterium]